MRFPIAVVVALVFCLNPTSLVADDDTDKLDAILKELKLLNARVTKLERQVRQLTAAERPAVDVSRDQPAVGAPMMIRQRGIVPQKRPEHLTPAEVIRLQIESPSSLMKGIHERERLLRQREFPAERPIPSFDRTIIRKP